jgi:hypothetical protein
MKSPEAITVSEIREAVFKKRQAMFLGGEISRLYECFGGDKRASQVSLSQIISQQSGEKSGDLSK